MMGSPESENWRIEDEAQHEVAVSSFYADPYEATQADYEKLMGTKPSTFTGERLPVENISWLDAVRYANAKSEAAGLAPVYTITSDTVSWDMSADGYRLPTGAETGTRHVYRGGRPAASGSICLCRARAAS